jgi:hypothetical protein
VSGRKQFYLARESGVPAGPGRSLSFLRRGDGQVRDCSQKGSSVTPHESKNVLTWPQDEEEFSLVLGGPLYQLYLRTKLSTPPLGLLRRRVLIIPLICWAPLLILAVIAGQALGGVSVPFLLDVEVHARFLVAVPLLIIAELIVHQRLVIVVRQFIERDIIAAEHRARFEKVLASTMRLRNSVLFEAVLLVFCFTVAHWIWRERFALTVSTWYAAKVSGEMSLSKAGYWYAFVSLPIFRFLLFRWYFRIFLWYQFLWRVRGLPLQLNLYHPDRAAGLGFLAGSISAFSPVLLAQTTLISAAMADRIWHTGARLTDFKVEIAGALLFLMLVVLVPLTFFAAQLERAHRAAKREFGILSSKYVDSFRNKWVQHQADNSEPLIGTPDLQSLADLGNSFKTVTEGGLFPFSKGALTRLLGTLVLPLLPLILTVIPLKEVVSWIVKLLF